MVLAGIIGASGWYYLADFAHTPFEATAASTVASLGVAISDVVADSIVVEKVRLAFCFISTHLHACTYAHGFQHVQCRKAAVSALAGGAERAGGGDFVLGLFSQTTKPAAGMHRFTAFFPAQNARFKLFNHVPQGERFGLPGRCRRAPIAVLGERGRGGSRQRLLLRIPPRKHVDKGRLLPHGVPAAGDHRVRHFYRRKAAGWVDGQVSESETT